MLLKALQEQWVVVWREPKGAGFIHPGCKEHGCHAWGWGLPLMPAYRDQSSPPLFFFGDKSLMLIWRDHHPRAPGTMHTPSGTITRHPFGCRYPVGTFTPRDVPPVSPEGDTTLRQTFFHRENMWGQLRVSPMYLIALQR